MKHRNEWLKDHKPLWDGIISKGWVFSYPCKIPGWIGITMQRGPIQATLYTEAASQREIHNRLLDTCCRFAAAYEPKAECEGSNE